MAVIALSGCMRRRPVAYAPPPPPIAGSLDAVAYGGPMLAPPPVITAPAPVAYVAPVPPAYPPDARARLRIVRYGQAGLTHTYAVRARRHSTQPPDGTRPAR